MPYLPRSLASIILLLLGGNLSLAEGKSDRLLLKEDFEEDASGELARKLLAKEAISLAKGAGPDGSDAIRVAYVGDERGSQRVGLRHPLSRQVERATLSFDVCFEKDFQWVRGGKLHGLGPKRPVTGGAPRKADSWSARIMFKKGGRCSSYLYDQSPTATFGVGETTKEPVFKAGKWHRVVFKLSLNEPGKAKGFVHIEVDGKRVMTTKDVEFRAADGPETKIQRFLFSTFHGGQSPKWAPRDEKGEFSTVHALFDNFLVEEGIE